MKVNLPNPLPLTRLAFERARRRWRQSDVAYLTGLRQCDISMLERGIITNPPERWLDALSHAFGISPGAVLLKPVLLAPDEVAESDDPPRDDVIDLEIRLRQVRHKILELRRDLDEVSK